MLRAVLLSGLQGQQTLLGLSKVILDFEGLAPNPISFHNHICQAGLLKLLLYTGGAADAWLAAAGSACSQPPELPLDISAGLWQVSAQPHGLNVGH